MMKLNRLPTAILAAATAWTLLAVPASMAAQDMTIVHKPVTWGVTGQPLTLKAKVAGGVGGINKVTLYYALFRDAAPFKVRMAASGMDLYVGTIEAGLLSGVNSLSYYIEAEDREGTLEETPWYDVTFKDPDPSQVRRNVVSPTGSAAAETDGGSALTVGLIAGGAAAVAVGAYVISDSGGGSDDDSGGGDSSVFAGNYEGRATTCLTIPPAEPECTVTAISILIDKNGKVFSDSLAPGQQLVGDLVGNTFSLEADASASETNLTGTIIFTGTVAGSQIVGSINGAVTSDGTPGFYSGDFNASK